MYLFRICSKFNKIFKPLVSKNHHPIVCLRTDHTTDTLSSLPLSQYSSNMRSLSMNLTNRASKKQNLLNLCSITNASKVKKSPSFIWKVSRKYSSRASNILHVQCCLNITHASTMQFDTLSKQPKHPC